MLASLQALQLDLDICRGRNCKRLVQLQQQECVVEQKHQDLVFLMQHYQEVIGKVPPPGAAAMGQAVQVPCPWPHVPCSQLHPAETPSLPDSLACANRQRSAHPAPKQGRHSCCNPVHPAEQSWGPALYSGPTDILVLVAPAIPELVAPCSPQPEAWSWTHCPPHRPTPRYRSGTTGMPSLGPLGVHQTPPQQEGHQGAA